LLKNPPILTKINDLRSAWRAAGGFGFAACRREADSTLWIVALEFGLANPDFAAAQWLFGSSTGIVTRLISEEKLTVMF